jgi:hypothetical protein
MKSINDKELKDEIKLTIYDMVNHVDDEELANDIIDDIMKIIKTYCNENKKI